MTSPWGCQGAGPRLSISASAAGLETEGRREKARSGQEGGRSCCPGPHGKPVFLLAGGFKGPEEADQEHSWQPGRSHSEPPGKVPARETSCSALLVPWTESTHVKPSLFQARDLSH